MTTDPQVVVELREMFLHGSTPSRLIRHIAERHEADADWPTLIDGYFDAAFGVVPFVRRLQGPNAAAVDLDTLDLSDLNGEVLRDIVGRRAGWKADGAAWWEGLEVSPDELKLIEGIRPEAHPAFADFWPTLPPPAQSAVRQAMVNAQAHHERCKVLQRLAERLQQQVVELERQPAGA